MGFELKPKKYDMRYLLGMPFACEPICTIGVVAQKVLTGIVNVLWVLVEAEFIDRGVRLAMGGETLSAMLPLLSAMLLMAAWKRMGYSIGRILTRRIEVSAAYQMSVEAVKKRARLKFKLVEDEKIWELSNRVSRDMKKNVWSMTQHTCNFINGLVRITGVFLIIFAQSIGLGIACFLLSLPVIFFSVISGKKTYKAYKEAAVHARRGDYLQKTMIDRESVDERALFAYVDYVNAKWKEQMSRYRRISIRASAQKEARNGISTVLTNSIAAVMVCFLIAELGSGTITIGIFIALSKAIYDMIDLIHGNIGSSLVTMARYASYMKDLTKFANMEEQEGACSLPENASVFESLEFRNVTFRYPGTEREILKDFSLKMEAGKHYAFVGENGAGKTTITKLLTGLYDNYEGSILLNGRELKEYTQGELKGIFTGVYQDFARYYDTVANNILLGDITHMGDGKNNELSGRRDREKDRSREGYRSKDKEKYESRDREKYRSKDGEKYGSKDKEKYGSKDKEKYGSKDKEKYESRDREKYGSKDGEKYGSRDGGKCGSEGSEKRNDKQWEIMRGHLKELGILDEMEALPMGCHTPLGKLDSGSVDLSGGQWQRVAMARCLMSPASVQILDEPTAALDPVSESRLYEEFERISKGRTTIFISHRLGSTGLADTIFVLQDGRVIESGSHKALMEQRGRYAQMYDSQKSWYQL